MSTPVVQIETVSYNAATQGFEALVSVHADGQRRRFACTLSAPITMSFEEAAQGLATQALRRHANKPGLSSAVAGFVIPQRAGRRKFDARRWLQSLMRDPGQRIA